MTSDLSLRNYGYKMSNDMFSRTSALMLACRAHGPAAVLERLQTVSKFDNIKKHYPDEVQADIACVETWLTPEDYIISTNISSPILPDDEDDKKKGVDIDDVDEPPPMHHGRPPREDHTCYPSSPHLHRGKILATMKMANDAMMHAVQQSDAESALVLVDTLRSLMFWMV